MIPKSTDKVLRIFSSGSRGRHQPLREAEPHPAGGDRARPTVEGGAPGEAPGSPHRGAEIAVPTAHRCRTKPGGSGQVVRHVRRGRSTAGGRGGSGGPGGCGGGGCGDAGGLRMGIGADFGGGWSGWYDVRGLVMCGIMDSWL